MEEVGEEVKEKMEERREGCVCSYLQYLISFLQHSMPSHWTLGMHILNYMMDAPCTEQNTQTTIKQDRMGYDIHHHFASWEEGMLCHPQYSGRG